MKYIGGEIEFENSSDKSKSEYSEIIKNTYKMYSTGRTAIKYVLKSLKPKYPVLLPSYMCESITQPFEELKIPYHYYRVHKDLSIDISFLKNLLERNEYSALLFINFFGFLNNHSQVKEIKSQYKDLVLLEDCTHSTFIPNLVAKTESIGDIVFGSLRKTLPLSDGAFILDNSKTIDSPSEPDNDFSKLKHHGKSLRRIYLNELSHSNLEEIYIDLLYNAEEKINVETPNTKISLTAESMLDKLDLSEIFQSRQRNYRFLFDKLKNDKQIQEIGYCISDFRDFEMPYMLPFFVNGENRNEIRSKLREKGVFVSVIWGSMPQVDKGTYSETYELADHILCFPVDQRYGIEDMNRIYLTLKEVISNEI